MNTPVNISLKTLPFVRFLLPLMAGILLQLTFHFSIDSYDLLIAEIILLLILFAGHFLFTGFSSNLLNGFFIYIFLVGYGLLITNINRPLLNDTLPSDGLFIAQVEQSPTKKNKTIKILLKIQATKLNNQWQSNDNKVLAYFSDSSALSLQPGDLIVITAPLRPVDGPKNPEEFDYRKYLAYHLITHQTFIRPHQWHYLSKNATTQLHIWFSKLRTLIINSYKQAGITGNNLAVLSALTVGDKQLLNSKLKQSFASTGAMHVLAVSGLHVGIIYLMLNYLLFFIKRRFPILQLIIILSALWFYALLTNSPPSIIRATLMFSFIAIGQAINRNTYIYNTIAASAFFILIINPYHITAIGFWLSYSAVLGIIYFYPLFYKMLFFGTPLIAKLVDKIWALVCVSIAAQLATFPVALYFFHQFPNWFILTNLFVIPIVTVIMFTAFLFFITLPFSPLHILVGKFLNFTLMIQNKGIEFLGKLPYETIDNIHLSTGQFAWLYVALIAFALFLSIRKAAYLQVILLSFIVIVGLGLYKTYHISKQRKFIVYAIPKASAYNFIDGNDNLLFSSLSRHDNKINFHIKNNWLSLGLKNEKILDISKLKSSYFFRNYLQIDNPHFFWKDNFIQFYDKKMVVFNAFYSDKNLEPHYKLPVDYILISDNASVSVKRLQKLFSFSLIIFDQSNSPYYLKRQTSLCQQLHIPYYSVPRQGAFVADI